MRICSGCVKAVLFHFQLELEHGKDREDAEDEEDGEESFGVKSFANIHTKIAKNLRLKNPPSRASWSQNQSESALG